MSFKETDFPALIKYLKKILQEETDPNLIKELLTQLVNLYEEVPIYPGIVNMCLGAIKENIKAQDLKIGQNIFVKNADDYYSGTVKSIEDDTVVLSAVKSVIAEEELDLSFKEMEQISLIKEDILKELWPSLVFDKEQK